LILGAILGKYVVVFCVKYQCLRVEIVTVNWTGQVQPELSFRDYVMSRAGIRVFGTQGENMRFALAVVISLHYTPGVVNLWPRTQLHVALRMYW
jgi:hypothetical protein